MTAVGRMEPAQHAPAVQATSPSHGGGKTAKQMNAEHQAWVDAQPRTAGCAFCGWSFDAADRAEADREFAAHREAAHPETLGRKAKRQPHPLLLGARTDPAEEHRARELAARRAADHARSQERQHDQEEEQVKDYECRVEGCENRTTTNRGLYAYRCPEHRKGVVQTRAAERNGKPPGLVDLARQVIERSERVAALEAELSLERGKLAELGERMAKAAARS